MDRIVYTAAGGAARVLEQQAVLSNNMANVSTTGFRAQLANYRSVPLVAEQGLPTRVGTVTSTPGSNFEQGVMAETGSALDVAITGEGWFSVQTPTGEALTRAGELAVNPQGLLVTQQGHPILSAAGATIEIPDRGTVTFTSDGSITALGAGDRPNDIQMLGQLKLSNPPANTLVRGDDGLFRTEGPNAGPIQADPRVKMVSGFIEKSNVSAAETMVGLIKNARQFEMQMKVIQDASTNAERANSILSSNG
ncbi:flagellar basal body rod protein FlgF [Eoetvoesiella caeni]|uniref:Flagellar basal-body rod protein FlgF n=1 Tax=Eoetvoesiella caeni TaxID=645616 RepID=A0A366HK20_9BURK|nr:flagellar basal body rod protein FlgF [Eoetvoesiella caeni]MCI2807287.1 flagellar basal body rod protein FlgF [Eoetvoesiella caeni]NYT53318.1 flagellar basal body rod protein FlgF [Eoetvoesiella caeni]RBP43300.1 flagellar basal-body rod protein FlgF [Eoetvoesiella caeni]